MKPGRVAARPTASTERTYQRAVITPPTLGIVANANIAAPEPGGAEVLENFLPTATSAKLRRGSHSYAVLGVDDDAVVTMFEYANGNNVSLFAANETAIYDVSTVSAPENQFLVSNDDEFMVDDAGDFVIYPATPDKAVSSLKNGNWSVAQFATSGGVFLRAVNGADTPLVYDGSAWGTSPAITGANPTTLSYVWTHQQRLFFIEKDTLSAWYLQADAIGGAATELPLAGVFELGGSLLFGSSWSLETGASGLSEQCIFVTTKGEVAVFRGTDPGSADTWAKVNQYRIGVPLGPKAHLRAGGDIAIATNIGLIPLSQALQKDFSVLSPSAVSAKIETIWNSEVADRGVSGWNATVWTANQVAIIAPPTPSGAQPVIYAVNTSTGAWGKITGWDATCIFVYQNRFFFGTSNGRIVEGNVTGSDRGAPYTGVYVPLFSDFGSPMPKTATMTRVTFISPRPVTENIKIQSDHTIRLIAAPHASEAINTSAWGTAAWGVDFVWGAQTRSASHARWQSSGGRGMYLAPAVQVTSGSATPLDCEIARTEVAYLNEDIIG